MTIAEIDARLAEIRAAVKDATGDALTALETETNELIAARAAMVDAANRRTALTDNIAHGTAGTPAAANVQPTAARSAQAETGIDSIAYKNAWLNNMRNVMLNTQERAAIATSDVSGAVPTQINSNIMALVKSYAPLINSITLLHANGDVKYAIESSRTRAAKHTENAAITDSDVSLTYVTLSAYELCKRVTISESVKTMTISGFESWLTNSLAQAMAEEINYLILFGTGSGEATGVLGGGVTFTDGTNQVTVTKTGTLTNADVLKAISMLPAKYDNGASFVMSKRTLFTAFMPLQDNSKNAIVTISGGNYYIQGYPVVLSDDVQLNDAVLGNWRKIVGNMPENATIRSGFDIDTNSYKYLCASMFDCKPAVTDAFVKITKATA